MALDLGEYLSDEETAEHQRRVMEIVSEAKKSSLDTPHLIEWDDFFDLYWNGGGNITFLNEPYCGTTKEHYRRHGLECMGKQFYTITEDLMMFNEEDYRTSY